MGTVHRLTLWERNLIAGGCLKICFLKGKMVVAFPQHTKMTARFWIEWLQKEANKQTKNNFISGENRVKTAVKSRTYISNYSPIPSISTGASYRVGRRKYYHFDFQKNSVPKQICLFCVTEVPF